MTNPVKSAAPIKSIVTTAGKAVMLKFATETDTWSRPFLSPDAQEGFSKAMEKADLPAGATTAIMT